MLYFDKGLFKIGPISRPHSVVSLDLASIHARFLMKTPLAVTMELMFPEGLKVTIGTERQRFSKLKSHFYKSRSAGVKKTQFLR
jgi:hypothetical protein